jgi:hypothetical protein
MKVQTNLKAGNSLNDVANLGCQSLQASANFVNGADRQSRRLVNNVTNATQSAWNTLTGWMYRA